VLQFRPGRASGVWLLKSKFSLSALRKSSAARLLQRYRNRPPEPKSRAPGKGGFVGVVGQLGLLWGASVPTRTRERRLVTETRVVHMTVSVVFRRT